MLVAFALAYGTWADDELLTEGAATLCEGYPAPAANEQVRALTAPLRGYKALRLRTGRQQQGALHLYRHYCALRRCFECPIARLSRMTSDE